MAVAPKRDIRDYADIIDLPHHVSVERPQMSMDNRAIQFAPFAALSGYGDLVDETARLVEEKKILDVQQRERLDAKLQILEQHMKERPLVSVVYYEADRLKTGGSYQIYHGNIKKIDPLIGVIRFEDGKEISLEDLYSVESTILIESGMEE